MSKRKTDDDKDYQFSTWELVNQGAEARIWRINRSCSPSSIPPEVNKMLSNSRKSVIAKERFKKTYRLEVLDKKITKQRVNGEVKCIAKCKKCSIDVPDVYYVDKEKSIIYMEDLLPDEAASDGRKPTTVRDFLIANDITSDNAVNVCKSMGRTIGKMHAANVIHGDLTTSNMFLRDSSMPDIAEVTVIDFGLASQNNNNRSGEDKAVDLYVLERAMISTHTGSEPLMVHVLSEYGKQFKPDDWKKISTRLEAVRQRGRKRECFG